MQFQLVAATDIAAKIEGSAIADQGAYLIDPGTNRHHRYVVAPLNDHAELREILGAADAPW